MTAITLYHNASCSKSRAAKALLEAAGVEHEVVEYLKAPLARAEILKLLSLLGVAPAELLRRDDRFAALGLDPDDYTTAESVADLLARHPELMQRPIVVRGGRALIARPPERARELL